MSATIPCPVCGTENSASDSSCRVCGVDFEKVAKPSDKCPRCGSGVHPGFEFCQVCGLRLRSRRPRPKTAELSIRAISGSTGGAPDPNQFRRPSMPGGAPARGTPAAAASASDLRSTSFISPGANMEFKPPTPVPEAPAPHAAQMAQGGQPAFSPPSAMPAAAPAFQSPAPAPAQAQQAPVAARPLQPAVPRAASPTPRGLGRPRLVVVERDGSEGREFALGEAPLTIGRTQGDVQFPPDIFISPAHARMMLQPDGVSLVDLGSRNGVYVRLVSPEPVYPGDLFLLGHQLLRLENLPSDMQEAPLDAYGVRGFGTPLQPPWGKIALVGVGDLPADIYYLRGSQVVFGRESGDVLFPRDAFLSRQHARIRMELRGGSMSVMLEDLGSANGTYLRMRGQALLRDGDMFRVGDQIFRLRMG